MHEDNVVDFSKISKATGTRIEITAPESSDQLRYMGENVSATQLWAASRLLQIMGDSVFYQQQGDNARDVAPKDA